MVLAYAISEDVGHVLDGLAIAFNVAKLVFTAWPPADGK